MARLLFDIETNGLLKNQVAPAFCMDKIHCIGVMDIDTRETSSFSPVQNNLHIGIKMLEEADVVLGHNIIDFDIRAIQSIYPTFSVKKIYDSLVMSRMIFADIKESDFRLVAKGKLEGRLIGLHGLEAWGQRLGNAKGDYSKERAAQLKEQHKTLGLLPPTDEEIHQHVWGEWNQEMHDYMMQDLEVNYDLIMKLFSYNWSEESTILEHQIHSLMVQQEENGFPFDSTEALKLTDTVREEYDALCEEAVRNIGKWYRPAKIRKDEILEVFGEGAFRRTWGEVTLPKRTASYTKSNASIIADGDYSKMRHGTVADCPFVAVELKEFNPNSRQQVTDRLQVLYGWEPVDFTEKGQVKIDDEIMRNLAAHIPLAETLAEVFYMKKVLGQLSDGKNGWLKLVKADGRIHGRVNCGGTVTGRATHSSPNISQVRSVRPVEFKNKKVGEDFIAQHTNTFTKTGKPVIVSSEWKEKKGEWKIITRGRTGEHGWDCRELFTTSPGYKLVGTDLSGVEFRCLANLTFPYDNGDITNVVLNGDIHQQNADLVGISRGTAKTLLYAVLYGAGDSKAGSIVEPLASEARQQAIGKVLKEKLMQAMPSLAAAIKAMQKEMRKNNGTIRGLDGRRLYARSPHSVLNLRLQSDGALIAKKWILLADDMFYEEGWDHGAGLDYQLHSWSHDEIQASFKDGLEKRASEITEAAAIKTGEYFNFHCPIKAEAKIGMNWAETH